MTPELAQLQSDIDAQTAAFLRRGGSITKLNYAGVPVEDEYGKPVHVAARAEPPEEAVADWCERVASAPVASAKAHQPALAPKIAAKPKPVPAAPAPDPVAVVAAELKAGLAHQQPSILPELRRIRADARNWLARLNRSFPQ